MPRAATLLALLLSTLTVAAPQAGSAAQPAGGPTPVRRPWDAQHRLPGRDLLPPAFIARHPAAARPAERDTLPGVKPGPAAGATMDTTARTAMDTTSGARAALDSLAYDSTAAPLATKSSWTAVGLSAILPGAGQVYTENYWKVPVILGLGGYWVYEWGRNNEKYEEYRDLYNESVETTPPYGDEQYLALREAYKDQRDAFAWYIGILYLLNIVDAYVGAELYDFDVGPDLGGGAVGASATLRIHL